MTNQQGKTILISVVVVISSYFFRDIVMGMMQLAFYRPPVSRPAPRPQPKAKPPEPIAHAPVTPAPAVPPQPSQAPSGAAPSTGRTGIPVKEVTPPSPFARFQGIWRGRAALDGRGICDLKFELREKPDEPGNFSGYSTMACSAVGALMPGKQVSVKEQTLNVMDPEAAIFTGKPENGSLQFHVDNTVGADSNGCAPTAFTLTPFGGNQLAAEWREATCRGGHMILGRARQ
jgi:hypothetical protein